MATKRETAEAVRADMEKRFPQEKPVKVKDEMMQVNFRMKKSEYAALMELLADDGLLFSQGIRRIVRAYLKQNGKI